MSEFRVKRKQWKDENEWNVMKKRGQMHNSGRERAAKKRKTEEKNDGATNWATGETRDSHYRGCRDSDTIQSEERERDGAVQRGKGGQTVRLDDFTAKWRGSKVRIGKVEQLVSVGQFNGKAIGNLFYWNKAMLVSEWSALGILIFQWRHKNPNRRQKCLRLCH